MSSVERSLPLFPEAPAESPVDGPAGDSATRQRRNAFRPATPGRPGGARPASLWLAVHLPSLPLEAFGGAAPAGPRAVVEQQGSRQVIAALDDRAFRRGLEPGQPLTGAYALAPALQVLERRPQVERAALERLAAWAGRFTSTVSLEPPAALLLEIRGSLRLYGGLDALRNEVTGGLRALGHAVAQGIAPTPLAALMLARAGDSTPVEEAHALAGRLGPLPLPCLGWSARILSALREMGVRRVGDCLRLPRDGFARRFGPVPLAELDRALGRRPDPREPFVSAPRFLSELELPAEISDTQRLLDAAGYLLDELGDFLRARQGGVRRFELRLAHADRSVTPLAVGLSAPSRDKCHLRGLLAERLERTRLPSPVLRLGLRSGAVRRLDPAARPLPIPAAAGGTAPREDLPRLVERLRARLGEEAVYGLRLVADHRPEAAWRRSEPAGNGDIPDFRTKIRNVPISRPLWMLPEPQRLSCGIRQGCLAVESGPERIETGWWDGDDVARDYYVAVNPRGVRLWVFRRRRPPRDWYLHGLFG